MKPSDQKPEAPAPSIRKEALKLWQFLLAVAVAHLLLIVILSPSLFGRDDNSPAGLLHKARALVEEKKYEEAQALYEKMLLQKPEMPAIFADAEKEMGDVRLQALQARKEASAAASAAEAEAETGEGESAASDKPGATGDAGTEGAEAPPAVDLPSLPDIGGDL